jgi:predicted phosphoribosyltransferase
LAKGQLLQKSNIEKWCGTVFADRRDAGRRLAARLQHLQKQDVSVLGIPRGGVIVAAEVAAALDAPLDVIVSRKIGAPFNPELAVGAVAPDGTIFYDEILISCAGIDRRELEQQAARELQEIGRRLSVYRGACAGCGPGAVPDYLGRTVILVDDGIATGYTVQAALRSLRRQKPDRLVLAVPVAPRDSLARIGSDADEVVCLLVPEDFYAVGQFYQDFRQTTDQEVIDALASNRARGVPTEGGSA